MLKWKVLSSLEKIFSDGRGVGAETPELTMLRGESLSFQVALENPGRQLFVGWTEACTPLKPYVSLRRVESVPVRVPRETEACDEGYLSGEAGLYPDLLSDMADLPLLLPPGVWRTLWVEIALPPEARAGAYPVAIVVRDDKGTESARAVASIQVVDAVQPAQALMHTEWFHSDCLVDYYRVPVFSDRYWEIVRNFVRTAARRGCNMLLTPHITPALDTRVGGERTTVQLVDIAERGGTYTFEFSKLKRWVELAFDCGMQWLEMAHLFTQWGARAAPKIMVRKDGRLVRRFGWDTPAVGGEYTRFLQAYLPALTGKLREWGLEDRCFFHISDEPSADQLESYRAAKQSVENLLRGFPVMDALSDYALFRESGIQHPVVALDHIDPFLEKGVSPLWGYYCCCQEREVTNRFMMMPPARARVLGMQMWKYRLRGFLHWGYNYYNTYHSLAGVDPYLDTEAGGAYPAGDAFLVYPGKDGKPEESIRLMSMHEAMQDAGALQLLESLVGREATRGILDSEGALTLTRYPRDGRQLLRIRNAINEEIARHAGGQG